MFLCIVVIVTIIITISQQMAVIALAGKLFTPLDLCASSSRRGHAKLHCTVPMCHMGVYLQSHQLRVQTQPSISPVEHPSGQILCQHAMCSRELIVDKIVSNSSYRCQRMIPKGNPADATSHERLDCFQTPSAAAVNLHEAIP